MKRHTATPHNQILDVVQAANDHITDVDALRNNVLVSLQKAIAADSAAFFLFNERLEPHHPVAINLAERYLVSYQAHYHRHNPFDPLHLNMPQRAVVVDSQLFQLREFKKTSIFNEFLRPQQVRRQMMIFLKCRNTLIGYIGLHRSDEKAAFTEKEQTIGEVVAPLLSQSLTNALLYTATHKRQRLLQTILDQEAIGVAVLDEKLDLVFQNKMAYRICATLNRQNKGSEGGTRNLKTLPPEVMACCANLKARLAQQQEPPDHFFDKCLIGGSTAKPYSVHTEVIDASENSGTPPTFLVTFDKNQSAPHGFNESRLAQCTDLTAREIDIVRYLFKGFRNTEIAHYLGISAGTVKNHLKKIFYKLGVSSRTSLVHEVLALCDSAG